MLLLLLPLLWEGSLCQNLEMQPTVTVQEGMCAHVPCTIIHNGLPFYRYNTVYGYWFRVGTNVKYGQLVATNDPSGMVEEGAQGRFHLLGDPRMNNCSLGITDAKFSDRGRYFFHLDYGNHKYSYVQETLSVEVTDLIQKPTISIPEVLKSGYPVTLNCTFPWACVGNKSLNFTWKGAVLSSKSQSSGPSQSSELSFIPGPQHHGTTLTCQVTLPGDCLSSEKTICLNVSYAVQNVTIIITQDNKTTVFIPGDSPAVVVKEGGSLQLLCVANGNPPAAVRWILGNQTLASFQPTEDGVLPLVLPYLGPADEGNYTCLAQHPLGSKQASLWVSVQYVPRPHVFLKHLILFILCGAGAKCLLASCLLLLVKILRKKSVSEASRGVAEVPKGPCLGNLSLNPISPAADSTPTPASPEDGSELHYACLTFQGGKAEEGHEYTDNHTEYSEISFQ